MGLAIARWVKLQRDGSSHGEVGIAIAIGYVQL